MHETLPDCAILGLGYLGRPLAQKLYENGCGVAAVKRHLTSDDINLPIRLDAVDLNRPDIFQMALWQHWAGKPTWFCLLPPSAFNDYVTTLQKWLQLAESFGVRHIIFTGSTSVYGDEVRECDETSTLQPYTDNAKQIAAAESLFLNSRIPHTDILRLGGLYSAERHPVTRLVSKHNINGGNRPVNVVHQDLAVATLFQTALNPNGKRIKNVVEPHHPSRAVFYAAEAVKLGLPAPDFNSDDRSSGKIVNTVCVHGLSL
ncbi:SDR family oxidoreductase [Neisseria iguanae]|uniref:NAD(P)-dependent oxidoreductase n=1 Tax=Neisseria iguanae TaxID=90242 RepID=A0A2P7TXE5_9NEIS|nr:SDR family oxidoreductase [Neisseria iguanae]PSJ79386.1 NAD(P)-dependent oxidoreductase [Neisseria iguanae]